ncbi:2,5-dioxovalerate dehydrogenase [Xaviernesmea oryzae]|uniref:2,5-dioxovalerate dehydrogenase n=1 Tax=Xaviernesmea oryzae TaxID=464029 RepID=A0A1Q9AT82_9HYPH|nr:aldehyde dehydrogenase (NADP(+)) [Xaviernesmea oryzae]OLP58644.1 2,5-dioxovalerate dehydrogenase [Xaviernesmea oryzae]SEK65466.1 NADP-dependent aldehyde dehydrogenase [Xaviernesmea oryzae]
MDLTGNLLIGNSAVPGSGGEIFGIDAATGAALPGRFAGATKADVDRAAALAWAAFPAYRETALEARAAFLEAIAENILAIGDSLIERAMAETGLPRGRLEGERMRTVNQLRLFAKEVREGRFQELRFDAGDPERKPVPKPDLKLRNLALGPVAVFGASNFPLAFSVAGGDTASALAAGCPVVVKAHSAHPGTSELVGIAVQKAVMSSGLPEGTFSLLFDAGYEIGQALVADARIRAVGFTGSRRGGLALMDIAAKRKQPIPVYAEMSAINPVILFPGALAKRGADIGRAFAGSLTLGAGQFCTNPGLILAIAGEGLEAFKQAAAEALKAVPAQTMLTPGICKAYREGVAKLMGHDTVKQIAAGQEGTDHQGSAALFEVKAADFIAHHELQEEVFGASGLIVACQDLAELHKVIGALEGQLTVALHIDADDHAEAAKLLPELELLAGRLLVNGFGTGVEVSPAMVHGGPYPATSDGRSTSVGTLAIERFLRPVCYQDFPDALLPQPLRKG